VNTSAVDSSSARSLSGSLTRSSGVTNTGQQDNDRDGLGDALLNQQAAPSHLSFLYDPALRDEP